MSKEWMQDCERALEEAYFHERDNMLIQRLREQGRIERERRSLARRLSRSEEDEFLTRLQSAGFGGDGLALLHLAPLLEVAWADGGVSDRERALVLALAEARGVAPDGAVHDRLTSWLDHRPAPELFAAAYQGVRALLAQYGETRRAQTSAELVAACTQVAEATGGVLGLAPISREERACLARIADVLHGGGSYEANDETAS